MRIAALGRIGLGVLTDADSKLANVTVDRLSAQLSDLTHLLDDARRAGMPLTILQTLEATRGTALTRLQSLADQLAFLSDSGYSGWVQEAKSLEDDINVARAEMANLVSTQGATGVRANISIATVLTIGIVGGALIWLWRKAK